MKKIFFNYLLRFNLLAIAIVFLLGSVALLDEFGDIGHKGGEAIVIALNIAILSAPLWGALFIVGLLKLNALSGLEYLFPVPMLFMVTFVFAVLFLLTDGFRNIC